MEEMPRLVMGAEAEVVSMGKKEVAAVVVSVGEEAVWVEEVVGVGEAAVGKESVGEADVGEESVGEADVGEESVGEADVGEESVGEADVGGGGRGGRVRGGGGCGGRVCGGRVRGGGGRGGRGGVGKKRWWRRVGKGSGGSGKQNSNNILTFHLSLSIYLSI